MPSENEDVLTFSRKLQLMELATRIGSYGSFDEIYKKMVDLVTNYEPQVEPEKD